MFMPGAAARIGHAELFGCAPSDSSDKLEGAITSVHTLGTGEARSAAATILLSEKVGRGAVAWKLYVEHKGQAAGFYVMAT
jgi:hypothetical protein